MTGILETEAGTGDPGSRRGGEPPEIRRSRLRAADLLPVGTLGLRSRRLRAVLSALGIAIGIASMVAVLGVTRSSQSALLAQLDKLGTNLLTVASGTSLANTEVALPVTAAPMVRRVPGVIAVAPTAKINTVNVYRNDQIPIGRTGGLAVRACDATLLETLQGSVMEGQFLTSSKAPVAVLGSEVATVLGINRLTVDTRVWVGGRWFTVIGILNSLPLASEIDRSALISFPAAKELLGYTGAPSRIYVRTDPEQVTQVANAMASNANPADPYSVNASRPSDALSAQLAVKQAGGSLFLGLGGIALLVGTIGIANVMVISVLERRAEIGLRRTLGATRAHIATQFLTESLILSAVGGLAGIVIGVGVTAAMAYSQGWGLAIPPVALGGGFGVAVVAGVVAGLYPALRASRLSPTDALRTHG
ncbi:ABC transporter permease [Nonomuraea guangzhouensis]|uniref:ABC transporter permease n=1 Tax=Nonomuraea guangzhouensis TaxID=1291555 RepID=A0ABW4FY14_9ACTN|nr:ABC transporter permease [Nonomuraea guangzhouensis]